MQAPTQKITTPKTKAIVEIKDWITGAEAEHIDAALFAGVEMKPDPMQKGKMAFSKFNNAAVADQTHREIETFIVSVNGHAEGILEAVKDLPEDDYEFVKAAIQTRRPKKKDDMI